MIQTQVVLPQNLVSTVKSESKSDSYVKQGSEDVGSFANILKDRMDVKTEGKKEQEVSSHKLAEQNKTENSHSVKKEELIEKIKNMKPEEVEEALQKMSPEQIKILQEGLKELKEKVKNDGLVGEQILLVATIMTLTMAKKNTDDKSQTDLQGKGTKVLQQSADLLKEVKTNYEQIIKALKSTSEGTKLFEEASKTDIKTLQDKINNLLKAMDGSVIKVEVKEKITDFFKAEPLMQKVDLQKIINENASVTDIVKKIAEATVPVLNNNEKSILLSENKNAKKILTNGFILPQVQLKETKEIKEIKTTDEKKLKEFIGRENDLPKKANTEGLQTTVLNKQEIVQNKDNTLKKEDHNIPKTQGNKEEVLNQKVEVKKEEGIALKSQTDRNNTLMQDGKLQTTKGQEGNLQNNQNKNAKIIAETEKIVMQNNVMETQQKDGVNQTNNLKKQDGKLETGQQKNNATKADSTVNVEQAKTFNDVVSNINSKNEKKESSFEDESKNKNAFWNLTTGQNQQTQQAKMTEKTMATPFTAYRDEFDVKGQVVSFVKTNFSNLSKDAEMIIKLRPEHLGDMAVQIKISEGVVTAIFKADNSETRKMIEQSLVQIKQELSVSGIKVNNVEVATELSQGFGEQQSSEQRQGDNNSQSGRSKREHQTNRRQILEQTETKNAEIKSDSEVNYFV